MPEYRRGTVRGGQQFAGMSEFLNLKKVFEDAKRQERWTREMDAISNRKSLTQTGLQEGQLKFNQGNNGLEIGVNSDYQSGGDSMNIYQTDPITGEVNLKGTAPHGSKVYKGVLSSDQMKERALGTGQAKAIEKDIESTAKLSNAVKRLGILNKQYKEAFPSGDKTPFEQRISGGVGSWAVKKGLYNNPKFLALQKNIRPIAINLVRMFGEVGNLSESEQKGAIDVVNQAGLTDAERIASTKQFIEFALAGASPSGIEYIKKNRSDIQGILDSMGVDIDGLGVQDDSAFSPTDEKRLQELEKKLGR